jgi:metal-responsive CopG/Arc/MetJ family transcriptional regulator
MRKSNTETKERITITIDKDLLEWLDNKISRKIFANRSHGIEYLIKRAAEEKHEK